jgi:hypothetical protein
MTIKTRRHMRLHLPISCAAAACLAGNASAQSWVTFSNQTASRLVASPALVVGDNLEKDFATGDFDRDGDVDVICARKFPGSIEGGRAELLLMNEDGVLVDRTSEYGQAADHPDSRGMLDATNTRDIRAVDVNNDGWLDLVTATTMSDTVSPMLGQPRVYMNLGEDAKGNWLGFRFEDIRIPTMVANSGAAANPRFCELAVGDYNGDGYVDLFYVDYDTPETSGTICIDLNSNGTTSDPGECNQSPGENPALDYNNRLLFNHGTNPDGPGPGHFYDTGTTSMTSAQLASAFGNACVAGDFNQDGLMDVMRVNTLTGGQDVAIIYNRDTGTGPGRSWTGPVSVYSNLAPYGLATGDINGDGRLDFVVADDGKDRYALHTGNNASGQALFSISIINDSLNEFGNAIIIEDLDLDGRNDVIICDVDADLGPFCPTTGRRTHFYRNTGVAGALLAEPHSVLPLADLAAMYDVAVLDINGDNWPDLVTGACSGIKVWINTPPQNLAITLPDGAPSSSEPGTAVSFPVSIVATGGSILDGSAKSFHRIDGGPWVETPLAPGATASAFSATLPGIDCGQSMSYYVQAKMNLPGNPTFTLPEAAPAEAFGLVPTTGTEVAFSDDMESDLGWTVANAPSLTAGGWQRGDPGGTTNSGAICEPFDDHTPAPGLRAWITQIALPGQSAGSNDVDGGPTTLTSPVITTDGQNARVSYWRWYYTSTTTQPDLFAAELSVDNGPWIRVELITTNAGAWTRSEWSVADFATPGNSLRVRFLAQDTGSAGLLEAGVDDFSVSINVCEGASCPADVNGDAQVNSSDLTIVLAAWGSSDTTADLNGDGNVDGLDLAGILSAWGACK